MAETCVSKGKRAFVMKNERKSIVKLLSRLRFCVEDCDQLAPKDGINRQTSGISEEVVNEIEKGDLKFYYQKGAQRIEMTFTRCPKGGGRLWFLCPECHRRVGKLYSPFAGKEYLCRRCHGLIYRSQQKSLTTVELLRLVNAVTSTQDFRQEGVRIE